jgi:glycosyltransferase involved in cell wall biosynthesis
MQEADLLVAPSRWETFSVAVAEALCRGLPVLATRVGALPELVDETSGILVDPHDPTALAASLDEMLDGLGRFDRSMISRRGIARWGAGGVGARWSELYAELASNQGGRRRGR